MEDSKHSNDPQYKHNFNDEPLIQIARLHVVRFGEDHLEMKYIMVLLVVKSVCEHYKQCCYGNTEIKTGNISQDYSYFYFNHCCTFLYLYISKHNCTCRM